MSRVGRMGRGYPVFDQERRPEDRQVATAGRGLYGWIEGMTASDGAKGVDKFGIYTPGIAGGARA